MKSARFDAAHCAQLKAEGFTPAQIEYLRDANVLVRQRKARNIYDILNQLGYGIIDEEMLQNTFFDK